MHDVVEVGNSLAEFSDTGSRAILATGHGDIDGGGTGKAASNVILNFGGTLAQVGPSIGLLEKTVLGGTLSTPNDTGGGTAGIETGVGLVAFVGITELSMSL